MPLNVIGAGEMILSATKQRIILYIMLIIYSDIAPGNLLL